VVVQANHRQSARGDVAFERTGDPPRSERQPGVVAEDQAVIVVVSVEVGPFLLLGHSVPVQSTAGGTCQGYPTATRPRLRLFEQAADMLPAAHGAGDQLGRDLTACDFDDGLPDGQTTTVVINIRPTQTAQFRTTETSICRQFIESHKGISRDVFQKLRGLLRLPDNGLIGVRRDPGRERVHPALCRVLS
jgi:hypothetical protein